MKEAVFFALAAEAMVAVIVGAAVILHAGSIAAFVSGIMQ
jgi:hypothetical protein